MCSKITSGLFMAPKFFYNYLQLQICKMQECNNNKVLSRFCIFNNNHSLFKCYLDCVYICITFQLLRIINRAHKDIYFFVKIKNCRNLKTSNNAYISFQALK